MKKSEGGRNRKEEEGLDRGLENRLKHEVSNPSDMKMCKYRKDGEGEGMGEELSWKMDNETRFDKEGEKSFTESLTISASNEKGKHKEMKKSL